MKKEEISTDFPTTSVFGKKVSGANHRSSDKACENLYKTERIPSKQQLKRDLHVMEFFFCPGPQASNRPYA